MKKLFLTMLIGTAQRGRVFPSSIAMAFVTFPVDQGF